ncbi:hypothetical protein Q0590_18460 [Rhodocytophaga aerolata]|uniref:LemA family protein n=1 Tax=Rhodocytophaga aerolata TaxID=455078 RepID=A0ABT8R8H3_9BACT|nr:hypothetical protein [Rhodocytophaga aerolata]MDO1448264.1 hypothetical protein [Rhodocytophaga aerolata]
MVRVFPVGLLLLLVGLICSCENRQKAQNTEVNTDSLQTQLIVLNDSVNQAWQVLVESDQLKEQSLKDLLEQIATLKNYNKPLHASLLKEQAALSQMRYTTPAALSSAIIDAYDAKSDSLKTGVYSLGASTPGFDSCALCGELKESIEKADNQTLFNRINYDKQAQAYNAFIKKHGTDLAAIRPAYENLSPLPLFQIAL